MAVFLLSMTTISHIQSIPNLIRWVKIYFVDSVLLHWPEAASELVGIAKTKEVLEMCGRRPSNVLKSCQAGLYAPVNISYLHPF